MRQILIAYATTLLVFLAGTFLLARDPERIRGLRHLRSAIFSGFVAVLLLSMRQVIPLFVSAVVAQSLLLLAFVYLHYTTGDVLERRAPLKRFLFSVYPLSVIGLTWFTVVQNRVEIRVFIISIAILIQLILTTKLVLSENRPELRHQTRFLFWSLAVMIGLRVARTVLTATTDPHPDVLHPLIYQAAISYLNLITTLAYASSLLWIGFSTQRQRFKAMAHTDDMTGLLNRRAFEDALEHLLSASLDHPAPFCVLLVDIDRFKEINDEYGHLAGDDIIVHIGGILRTVVRPADALARFGGDEFIVLLPGTSAAQGAAVAERMRREVAGLRDHPIADRVTVSIGVAENKPGDTLRLLIGRADQALYRSKAAGRNRVSATGEPSGLGTTTKPTFTIQ